MESTPQNLPERLMAFHALAKDRPALAVAAPIVEAAEEIKRLRERLVSISAYAAPYRDDSFGALDRIAKLAADALEGK